MKVGFGSRKGMSLVEVMVTTAVASIVMVAIGNSLLSLYQHQTTLTKKDEANEFLSDFSRLIAQNDVCTTMLNGVNLPGDGTAVDFVIPDYITFKRDEAVADPVLDDLAANTDITDGLRALSLNIRNSTLTDETIDIDLTPNDADPTLTTVIRRLAEVELRLGVIKANEVQEMKPRRFKVPVMVLQSNENIHSCATELQVTDACATLGSGYDPATGSCLPQTNCFMKGAYTVVNCTSSDGQRLDLCPQPVMNKITGAQNCPGAGMATESGRNEFQMNLSCGKKCSRRYNVEVIYYICLECS